MAAYEAAAVLSTPADAAKLSMLVTADCTAVVAVLVTWAALDAAVYPLTRVLMSATAAFNAVLTPLGL
jgi:hypothetical protein